jgi:3-oxoacyl-(acyl-carrier-protein) synthase
MMEQTTNRPGPDRPRVAVVAAGVISPLGAGLAATLAALREARDCVSPVTRFPVEQCRCSTAGQVADEWLTGVMPNDRKSRRLHRPRA